MGKKKIALLVAGIVIIITVVIIDSKRSKQGYNADTIPDIPIFPEVPATAIPRTYYNPRELFEENEQETVNDTGTGVDETGEEEDTPKPKFTLKKD